MRDFFQDFRSGDNDAREKLSRKFSPYTACAFFLLTGRRHEAEDLSQELWAELYEHPGSFVGGTYQEFFLWLKGRIYTLFWTYEADAETKGQQLSPPLAERAGEMAADVPLTPVERMIVAMSRLKGADRDVLIFFFYQDLDSHEAAHLLGVPTREVSLRLHRALVNYQRALHAVGASCDSVHAKQLGERLSMTLRRALAAA